MFHSDAALKLRTKYMAATEEIRGRREFTVMWGQRGGVYEYESDLQAAYEAAQAQAFENYKSEHDRIVHTSMFKHCYAVSPGQSLLRMSHYSAIFYHFFTANSCIFGASFG